MSHKPVEPPEILYEYVNDGDLQAINDAFNYLFDHYFRQLEKESKE